MTHYTISLDPECDEIIKNAREDDMNFNLSKYVRNTLIGDETLLTEEQIKMKLKVTELEIEKMTLEAEHLKRVIPLVKEKKEQNEISKADRMESSVITLVRVLKEDGEDKLQEFLPIHVRMTEVSKMQLEKAVRDRLNNTPEEVKKDLSWLNEEDAEADATWEEKERIAEEKAKAKELARIEKFGN